MLLAHKSFQGQTGTQIILENTVNYPYTHLILLVYLSFHICLLYKINVPKSILKWVSTYTHRAIAMWIHLIIHHLFSVKINHSIWVHLVLNSLEFSSISGVYWGISKGNHWIANKQCGGLEWSISFTYYLLQIFISGKINVHS